jgi:hypothetical protein
MLAMARRISKNAPKATRVSAPVTKDVVGLVQDGIVENSAEIENTNVPINHKPKIRAVL